MYYTQTVHSHNTKHIVKVLCSKIPNTVTQCLHPKQLSPVPPVLFSSGDLNVIMKLSCRLAKTHNPAAAAGSEPTLTPAGPLWYWFSLVLITSMLAWVNVPPQHVGSKYGVPPRVNSSSGPETLDAAWGLHSYADDTQLCVIVSPQTLRQSFS